MTVPDPGGATDLVLRPRTEEDTAEIAELYLAARSAAAPAMPPLAGTRAEMLDRMRGWLAAEPEGREVWVAEDDLGLAGYLVLTGAWVDALYVAPDRQGSGVGGALLDLAKALRPPGFGLWVFADNAPARGFYHRHGLLELEHTDGTAAAEGVPEIRMAWPGETPLEYLRGEIDAVDDELAVLLARRFALTAAVQGYKPRGGHADRDPDRERAIVARMARHAPGLSEDRIAPIMAAVIAESLTAWEHAERRLPYA